MSAAPHTLVDDGFRFVLQHGVFGWVHLAEVMTDSVDCTDMSDTEFEDFVREHAAAGSAN